VNLFTAAHPAFAGARLNKLGSELRHLDAAMSDQVNPGSLLVPTIADGA
jgi:hypothetical protein